MNRSGVFERKLCNFAPWIESEVAVCDGEQTVNHAKLKGLHESGRTLDTITIPAEDVLSLNWLHKHWGLHCMIEPVKGARSSILRALQSSVEYASKERLYSVTGWTHVDGVLQYLMPGNESVSVMLQGKLHGYHMEHSWTIDDICSVSQLLLSPPAPAEVIFPLLAVTFLSPLNHFLKEARCEPKFVVFLMGKTGSRKSTLAALMLSFYGRFTASELPLSFRDMEEQNIFSGLVYCADCGGTMVLHRAHTIDAVNNNFMCSTYKQKGKDVCTSHYFKEVDLAAILLDDIRRVTHFARQNEMLFAQHISQKHSKESRMEMIQLQKELGAMEKRQAELTMLFKRLYEDNIMGRIPDEQYRILSQDYTRGAARDQGTAAHCTGTAGRTEIRCHQYRPVPG